MIVVIHNNGKSGSIGYTEYTPEKIAELGGVAGLKSKYATAGITISKIYQNGKEVI